MDRLVERAENEQLLRQSTTRDPTMQQQQSQPVVQNISPRHKRKIDQSSRNVNELIQKLTTANGDGIVSMMMTGEQRYNHTEYDVDDVDANLLKQYGIGGYRMRSDVSDHDMLANYFQSNKELDDMVMTRRTGDDIIANDDGSKLVGAPPTIRQNQNRVGGVHILNPDRSAHHTSADRVALASSSSSGVTPQTNYDDGSSQRDATTNDRAMDHDSIDELLRKNNLLDDGSVGGAQSGLFDDIIDSKVNNGRIGSYGVRQTPQRNDTLNIPRSSVASQADHGSLLNWIMELLHQFYINLKMKIIPLLKRLITRVRYINPYMRPQFRNRQLALTNSSLAESNVQSVTSYKNFGLLSNSQIFGPGSSWPVRQSRPTSNNRIDYEQVN